MVADPLTEPRFRWSAAPNKHLTLELLVPEALELLVPVSRLELLVPEAEIQGHGQQAAAWGMESGCCVGENQQQ